ncbi:pyrimidine reductase family protein [Salinibacterium sp. ZJ454]|uniref:pyrimidine reductase family protein n=1 Tax=Salinibacterium sp. ZJ454 TaxID=2708339 RepID=UPI00142158D7|nr:pyrimidine reductase family protein [Salinibacterium sp. ZJ454]
MTDEVRRLGAMFAATDDEITDWYTVPRRADRWLRVNFIASLDGAATHDGRSAGLGTPADKRVFGLLRRLADVILIGAGTVRAEGYGGQLLDDAGRAWREERGLPPHPVVAVVSARLDLDPDSPLFSAAPVRPLVLTTRQAPAERRAALAEVSDVLDSGGTAVDTRLMRELLAERGLRQVHCEGGPHLLGTLIEEGTVDELCLTLSPRLEGGTARRITDGGRITPTGMTLAHVLTGDDGTLLLRYVRAQTVS